MLTVLFGLALPVGASGRPGAVPSGTADEHDELPSLLIESGDLDAVQAVAVSGLDGDVYLAGTTDSANFPGTAGGPQPTFGGVCGPNEPNCHDGFVARLGPDLKTLTRASYLGGSGNDSAVALTLSGAIPISIFQRESMLVAGITSSINFPGTTGGAQPLNGGGAADGFVATLALSNTFRGVLNAVLALEKASCIGAPVGDALTTQLTTAETLHRTRHDREAVSTLNDLLGHIEAESGKHIAGSCTMDGITVNPAGMLISDVLGLIDDLQSVGRPTPRTIPAQ